MSNSWHHLIVLRYQICFLPAYAHCTGFRLSFRFPTNWVPLLLKFQVFDFDIIFRFWRLKISTEYLLIFNNEWNFEKKLWENRVKVVFCNIDNWQDLSGVCVWIERGGSENSKGKPKMLNNNKCATDKSKVISEAQPWIIHILKTLQAANKIISVGIRLAFLRTTLRVILILILGKA